MIPDGYERRLVVELAVVGVPAYSRARMVVVNYSSFCLELSLRPQHSISYVFQYVCQVTRELIISLSNIDLYETLGEMILFQVTLLYSMCVKVGSGPWSVFFRTYAILLLLLTSLLSMKINQ